MNKYEVVISPRAKVMLGECVGFVARVNKAAAKREKTAIMNAVRSLEVMPERYAIFEQLPRALGAYRRMVVNKRYLVVFKIVDVKVCVDYVVDCRQNVDWLNS